MFRHHIIYLMSLAHIVREKVIYASMLLWIWTSLNPTKRRHNHAKDQVTETCVFFSCSAEDDDMISKALGPGPPEEELSKCCTISIRREYMWTLKMSGWLNVQVRKIITAL